MSCKPKFVKRFLSLKYYFLSLTILLSASGFAQTPTSEWRQIMSQIEPETYICHMAGNIIEIDGKINEKSWEQAPWTNDFVDLGPKTIAAHKTPAPAPRLKTRVKMLWDDQYFYIAADLEEPHVWGTLLWHDQIICLENNFEIFIDANGDNHNYIEIEINALNTVWDLVLDKPYRDKCKPDQAWNIRGLKKAVYVNGTLNNPRDIDTGWFMEMAIPWKSIAQYADSPCPPNENDQWRINFARTEYEHEIIQSEFTTKDVTNNAYQKKKDGGLGIWSWSSHGVCNLHLPEMFGMVQFSRLKPNQVNWIDDPVAEARLVLMDIYYAQRDYSKAHSKYAADLEVLGLENNNAKIIKWKPLVKKTDAGYQAWVLVKNDNEVQKLMIQQDSKLGYAGMR